MDRLDDLHPLPPEGNSTPPATVLRVNVERSLTLDEMRNLGVVAGDWGFQNRHELMELFEDPLTVSLVALHETVVRSVHDVRLRAMSGLLLGEVRVPQGADGRTFCDIAEIQTASSDSDMVIAALLDEAKRLREEYNWHHLRAVIGKDDPDADRLYEIYESHGFGVRTFVPDAHRMIWPFTKR